MLIKSSEYSLKIVHNRTYFTSDDISKVLSLFYQILDDSNFSKEI